MLNQTTVDTIVRQRTALVAQNFDIQQWKIEDRLRRFLWTIAIFLTIDFLFIAGITAGQIWVDWQTKDWHDYSNQTNEILPMLAGMFSFFHIILMRTANNKYRAAVLALRRAAARGDERLTPIAAVQPAPLAVSEYVYGIERIGPLRGLVDRRRSGLTILGAALLFFFAFMFGGIGTCFLISLPQVPTGDQQRFLQIVVVAVSGFLVVAAVVSCGFAVRFIIRGRQIGKGIIVEADEMVLRWQDKRWGTGKHTLAWGDVQSFVTCQYQGLDWQQTTFYALQGANETFLWSTNYLMPDAEVANAERLCRLAVSRTKKPLRVISYPVRGLALASYLAELRRRRASAIKHNLHPGDIAALTAVETIYTPFSQRRMIRSTIILVAIFWVMFLLFVPGPWLLQHLR